MDFLEEAIAKLSATPQQTEDLACGLSEEQLSWKPTQDIFSMRENILHLRDIDILGYEKRIGLILSEDSPRLGDLNGRKLAREGNYNARPIRSALDDFRGSRTISIERIQGCSDKELGRKAEMQGVGVIDLRRLLELWMEHDRGHIVDMMELRRAIQTGEGPTFVEHQAA